MMILINVFAFLSAILYYSNKIRPEAYLLGSLVWLLMMVSVWFILPYTIYSKTAVFKDQFIIYITDATIRLENEKGGTTWDWDKFSSYFESPHFFHLYFDTKTFFLIPKENMDEEGMTYLRALLNKKVGV